MNARQTYFHNDSAHDLGYLYSRDVAHFVHFTHLTNVPEILRTGLWPRASLDQAGTQYVGTDGLRLDGKNAVNLSITHPNINMFYGKRKELPNLYFVVLTLDPALLRDAEGTYEFRRGNAASSGSRPSGVEDLFSGVRPNYFEPNWTTNNQAEVRVRGRIDPRWIKTIQFPSDYYNRFKPNPSGQPWPDYLAGLARELGLPLEVLLCDRHFHYYKSPIGKQYEQKRFFDCRVVHPKGVTAPAASGATASGSSAPRQQKGSVDRLAQESVAMQKAAASLTTAAQDLAATVAVLEMRVSDASKVTATAKGEATKAEKFHRKAASLLESTQVAIRGIETSISEMQAACTALAQEADVVGQRDCALLERIEKLEAAIGQRDLTLIEMVERLESTIGRIDRNTQKGFGKERG